MAQDSFQLVSRCGLVWLESTALARLPWLVHGFSTRRDAGASASCRQADFNLGSTHGAASVAVKDNRRRFLDALGARTFTLASLKQIHSATVYQVVGDDTEGSALQAGDALVTRDAGIALTVRTADCLPLLLADRRRRVVAAVHAGWRGALARVIETTVGELQRLFDARPEDLVAALGPCIGACCYQVGPEVVDAFQRAFAQSDPFFHRPPANRDGEQFRLRYPALVRSQAPPGQAPQSVRLHLDLVAVARAQLQAAGLMPSAIHDSGYCTVCRPDLFFSHRRDGAPAGRMMAAIGIRPGAPSPFSP